jgi:hypothetical protein
VEAVRAGRTIRENILFAGLTNAEAFQAEARLIGHYHKNHTGQLWNTIDERFMDPRYLPEEWSNPAHPLYRLPRPFAAERKGDWRADFGLAAVHRRHYISAGSI